MVNVSSTGKSISISIHCNCNNCNGDGGTGHSLNVYYNGQAGDWNIDFNADGLWSYRKMLQDMSERYTLAGEESQEQRVTSYNKDENTLYAAKLVVSRPLWQGNLSFGTECDICAFQWTQTTQTGHGRTQIILFTIFRLTKYDLRINGKS